MTLKYDKDFLNFGTHAALERDLVASPIDVFNAIQVREF